MSGNYRGGRGGQRREPWTERKDFKADPIKQYLICRGCANDRAVELCIAGKIDLSDIPDYTDRLTVLRMGQLEIDPKVSAEIIRIASRVQERRRAHSEEAPARILCETCVYGPSGTDECCDDDPDFPYDATECVDYESGVGETKDDLNQSNEDMENHVADERLQEKEDQQRQTEEEQALEDKPATVDGQTTYTCATCKKVYKTMRGLQRHMESQHG
jgi:hypothetical protein